MPTLTIFDGIKAIYQAYQAYKDDQEQDRKTEQIISEIVAALDRTRNEIIAKIVDQLRLSRRADLDGDIRGLQTRFMEYQRYDKQSQREQWSQESNRLLNIIDESASVIGDLEAEIDTLNLKAMPDAKHAGYVFTLYAAIVPLRATAMRERSFIYGTVDGEHIPAMFTKVKSRAVKLQPQMRRTSDSRFSSSIVRRRGEPMGDGQFATILGYNFESKFRFLAEYGRPPTAEILQQIWKRANQKFSGAKDSAFRKFPGVRAILAVLEWES